MGDTSFIPSPSSGGRRREPLVDYLNVSVEKGWGTQRFITKTKSKDYSRRVYSSDVTQVLTVDPGPKEGLNLTQDSVYVWSKPDPISDGNGP